MSCPTRCSQQSVPAPVGIARSQDARSVLASTVCTGGTFPHHTDICPWHRPWHCSNHARGFRGGFFLRETYHGFHELFHGADPVVAVGMVATAPKSGCDTALVYWMLSHVLEPTLAYVVVAVNVFVKHVLLFVAL